MSARFELTIAGASLWTPGYADPAAFARRERDDAIRKPTATLLPARLRRRTSLLTRMVAEVFAQAAELASVERGEAGVVFASAFGEIQTTGTLLSALTRDPGDPLSPVRFHNSVHNTPTGYVSIATANRGFNTALAAGRGSVAMALLEAATVLAAGRCDSVVVAIAEEPLPAPLDASCDRYAPLAVGLALARDGDGPRFTLSRSAPGEAARLEGFPSLPDDLRANPCQAALRVVELWQRARAEAEGANAQPLAQQPPVALGQGFQLAYSPTPGAA